MTRFPVIPSRVPAKRASRNLLFLAILSLAILPTSAAAQAAAVTPARVSGRLDLVWGDPIAPGGAVQLRTFVFDEATRRSYEVTIDSVMARRYGGVIAMNRKRVTLNVRGRGLVSAINSVTQVSGAPHVPQSPLAEVRLTFGTKKYVVLPCRYAGIATEPALTPMTDLHVNSSISVKNFWEENSDGQASIQITGVQPWQTLPQGNSFYAPAPNNVDLGTLMDHCVAAHDAAVDFTQVDGVIMQVNGNLGCCFWGGGKTMTLDGETKFMMATWYPVVSDFQLVPGTYAHEIGHTFGLPHSQSIGKQARPRWDVMAETHGFIEGGNHLGAQTLAVHKSQLGWIAASRKFVADAASSTVTLERSALPGANANYQLAVIPWASHTNRYYTIELRKSAGFDRAIPGEGVVIQEWYEWRAEPAWTMDQDGNGNPDDAGAVWTAGETFFDKQNNISVTVESVDATSAVVTIRNGSSAQFALGALGGKRTVVAGAAAVMDSVQVQINGVGGQLVPWSAQKAHRDFIPGYGRHPWLQLDRSSGEGPGYVRIRHDPTGMGAGVFVDSLKVESPAFGSTLWYKDTLEVTAPPQLFIGLSQRSKADSTMGNFFPQDSVRVYVSGPGASSAQWTATAGKPWTLPAFPNGTGTARFDWIRHPDKIPEQAPGIYVDTITFALVSDPSVKTILIDTIKWLPPVQYTFSRPGRRYERPQGAAPQLDSSTVEFNAPYSTIGLWYAKQYGQLTGAKEFPFMPPVRNFDQDTPANPEARGVGNGKVYFYTGNPLATPGTYVDSLIIEGPWKAFADNTVPGHQSTRYIIDTLVVTAAARSLVLSAPSRRDTVALGLSLSRDSIVVEVRGPDQKFVEWQATSRNARSTLRVSFFGAGKGRGTDTLIYERKLAGLAVGVHVDTIDIATVEGTAATAMLIDTLVIVPATALAVLPGRRRVTRATGTAHSTDSADVAVVGVDAVTTAWTATKKKAWTTLTTSAGTGPGKVRWKRNTNGLAFGTYVDTITMAAGGSIPPVSIIDSFVVTAAPVPALARLTPDSTGGLPNAKIAAVLGVDLTNTGATLGDYAATVTWDPAIVQLDSVRGVAGGFTAPTVGATTSSSIELSASDAGKSGNVGLATLHFTIVTSTLATQTAITPALATAQSPGPDPVDLKQSITLDPGKIVVFGALMASSSGARKATVLTGTPRIADSVEVNLTGPSAASVEWTATKRGAWTTLTTAAGTGNGKLRWRRNPNGLALGTHVDTFTVVATGGTANTVIVLDTFVVQAPAQMGSARITPDSSGGRSSTQHTLTLGLNLTGPGGTLGSYVASVTFDSLIVQLDSVRGVASGFPAPLVTTARKDSIVLSATDGTGKTGDIGLARLYYRIIRHEDGASSPVVPTFTSAMSPDVEPIDLRLTFTSTPAKITSLAPTVTLSAASRRSTAVAGGAPVSDSVDVQITGSLVSTTEWTVTKRAAWTTLAATGGTGPAKLRWTKSPNQLGVGTYVDTITVASIGLASRQVIDTLVVAAPTVTALASVTPDSSGGVIGMEVTSTVAIDLAAVGKSLASYSATVSWDSTVVRLDSVRGVAGGFVAPTSTSPNAGSVSLTATDAAGKTGAVALARLHFRIVGDAAGLQTTITPAFTAAASIASENFNLVPSIVPKAGKVALLAGALRGDVNLDGKVTAADVPSLMRSLVGATPAGVRSLPNGDANCNGKLEAIDAQIILRQLAGLSVTEFCVGTIK